MSERRERGGQARRLLQGDGAHVQQVEHDLLHRIVLSAWNQSCSSLLRDHDRFTMSPCDCRDTKEKTEGRGLTRFLCSCTDAIRRISDNAVKEILHDRKLAVAARYEGRLRRGREGGTVRKDGCPF